MHVRRFTNLYRLSLFTLFMAGLGQEVFIPNMSFTSGNQSPLIPEKTSTALKGSPNQLNVCYKAFISRDSYNRPLYCLPAIGNRTMEGNLVTRQNIRKHGRTRILDPETDEMEPGLKGMCISCGVPLKHFQDRKVKLDYCQKCGYSEGDF